MRRTKSILALGLAVATMAAIGPVAVGAPTAAAGPNPAMHLPHFDLLDRPTSLEAMPRILRVPFEKDLPRGARHGFWKGKVRLPEGTITAIGNRRLICFEHRLHEVGAGSCDRTRRILHKGLSVSSFCVGGGEEVRISGLVPNGITALGVDRRADGSIEEEVPVRDNAFSVVLEPAGVVLHAIGPDARGLAMKYPLGRLSKEGRLCGEL
ncbi:MAG: hypothetical protein J0H06_04135 [Actinobacteria bacterium]|nr:hypothetical protein [Actinomycetota bacterium]